MNLTSTRKFFSSEPYFLRHEIFSIQLQIPLNGAALHQMSTNEKIKALFYHVLATPVGEEFIFRWVVQEVLLNQLPQAVCQRFKLKKICQLDSKTLKWARISVAAIFFSAIHGGYKVLFNSKGMKLKFLQMFLTGVYYGKRKEEKGIRASIRAHMINNGLAAAMWTLSLHFLQKEGERRRNEREVP